MKLLIGGSPCTHWSIAQTKNRETEPSGIGWELFKNYLIAREKYKPDYFLYENNKSMSAAIREQITRELGVEPILINSSLVSAQNRQRLYWTNIPGVQLPEDRGILLRDILESGVSWRENGYALLTTCGGATAEDMIARHQRNGVAEPICLNPVPSGKSRTVDAHMGKLENNLIPRINNPNPAKQQYDCVAKPLRIGVVEGAKENRQDYSKQYRVYFPDAKGTALCGNGGGMGAKTGLYAVPIKAGEVGNGGQGNRIYSVEGKSVAQTSQSGGLGSHTGLYAIPVEFDKAVSGADGKTYDVHEVKDGYITIKGKQYPIKLSDGFYIIRKLTVTECKRLQTVPESYVFPTSQAQAYKMLGNGWTVDVIAHILQHAPGITKEPVEVLSMYDGMSCGHLALDKLGVAITRYYATEIDKYAIQTTQHNYPETVQLGDAFQVRQDGWSIRKEEP